MYRVLITGAIHPIGVELLKKEPDLEVDFMPDLPMPEIMEIVSNYQGIITRSETPVQRELIDQAPDLKVIARAAVGYANIDVDYATQKGILVVNTPGKNTNSAAELAMSLLLAVTRKLVHAHENMLHHRWDRHRFKGIELMHKTIGIVGLGNVGHRMARFAHGFDMNVIAYDPYISDDVFEQHQTKKVDLDTLLQESDIISMHVPKNRETTGMIGKEELARTRPGVVIVNAARGGVIDEPALHEALKSGHVSGAGIDTWASEPPTENPFAELPNVVMSPHIGASTEEAQMRVAESIAVQVPRALRGEIVDSPVNMPQIRTLEGDLMTSYTVLAEKLGTFAAQFIDFKAENLSIRHRGTIAKQDCTLLRLAFLKGLLKNSLEYVSYVNAEDRAHSIGLKIRTEDDPSFRDYESALTCVVSGEGRDFAIGGVVFRGPHARISLIDSFKFEVDPEGTFLAIRSKDRLGVVSGIASILDKHNILINSFEFSHSAQRKRSMFLIRVGKPVSDHVLEEFRKTEHITLAQRITI
jgi:D-3-phosphoglycerate dehydrogenase